VSGSRSASRPLLLPDQPWGGVAIFHWKCFGEHLRAESEEQVENAVWIASSNKLTRRFEAPGDLPGAKEKNHVSESCNSHRISGQRSELRNLSHAIRSITLN
jgi:hypothetical protein